MTPANESSGERRPPGQLDDATAERLLAGRAVPPELESVATVVRTLRGASAQPVRPSDALRRQMAAGVFTDGPVYAYRPATGSRLRRVGTALAANLARTRLAVKVAAAVLAAAVLSTATAGFAGSLPEPVQDRFETVVETVTPYQFPKKAGGGPAGPAGGPDTPEPGAPEPDAPDPTDHGGEVSEDARDGGVEGPEVSERARERDHGRPTDLPTPAQKAPGQQRRPTAPPGQRN